MKYWARLKLNNLETIQKKSLDFIKKYKDTLAPTAFNPLDFEKFVQEVPELGQALKEHGLTLTRVSTYIMYDNSGGAPHRDFLTDSVRINIPVLNCENTWTNFYKADDTKTKPTFKVNEKGMPYRSYNMDDIILVDRVQITEPTAIRPLEIHSIEMDESKFPRITLTVCTDPVPEFLLNETSSI